MIGEKRPEKPPAPGEENLVQISCKDCERVVGYFKGKSEDNPFTACQYCGSRDLIAKLKS